MAIEVKICGLSDEEGVSAALAGGADLLGFVFYPPSPRYVTPAKAAALCRYAGERALRVGLFVDPSDDLLSSIVAAAPLDMIQLHGKETPQRVAEVRERFGHPVMKALPVAEAADLEAAEAYLPVADRLLFDAKPPKGMKDALPGGNALSFDWKLLAGRDWPRPWMLAGGLSEANLAEAVAVSGARRVDVSSGVESKPGVKDPTRISALLALAKTL